MRRAVFFDRDGTLMEEVNYCSDPALVRVFPGVAGALRRLKAAGFALFLVTNQSGIGRGMFTDADYQAVHREFLRQTGEDIFDGAYYCPDAPGVPSQCRKPAPGMVLQAAAEHGIELPVSFMVGDKPADIECGRSAGTRTIQVRTGYGASANTAADFTVEDAVAAVDVILAS